MYETFRPRSNYAWAGVSFTLILLFAANSFFVVTNVLQMTVEFIFCLFFSGLAYALWIRPKLVFKDEVIEVVNPFGRKFISYRDVLELETKWALTIIHRQGRTRVWVAPASGKRRWIANTTFGFYGANFPQTNSKGEVSETMSASLDSFSGQAAYMIRERIRRLH